MKYNIYKELLNHVDEIIILKDKKNKLIFANNEEYKIIDNLKIINNEIKFNNCYYEVIIKKIIINKEEYELKIYKNITNEKKIIKNMMFDKLTNLYNYGKIQEELSICVNEYEKNKENFVVAMADIDDFKLVNDTIGHVNGNHILKNISNILKKNIDKNDKVGRFGGEEFLLIFKNSTIEESIKKVNKIRNEIMNLNLYNITVTISFGLDEFNGTKNIKDVLNDADKALYYAKKHGKNNCRVFKNECVKNSV